MTAPTLRARGGRKITLTPQSELIRIFIMTGISPSMLLLLVLSVANEAFRMTHRCRGIEGNRKGSYSRNQQQQFQARKELADDASLLPDPPSNAIGNFFEDRSDGSMSFIQVQVLTCFVLKCLYSFSSVKCYMLNVGKIAGKQYGIGYPVDMPVMLTYFEGNELQPVRPDYPDYDHLINHVSVQVLL